MDKSLPFLLWGRIILQLHKDQFLFYELIQMEEENISGKVNWEDSIWIDQYNIDSWHSWYFVAFYLMIFKQ